MRWDIFCTVIDNHGDIGICWRLCRQLAAAGETVRLWVDDDSALAWMAPGGHAGIRTVAWRNPAAVEEAVQDVAPEVLVEAFGCEPEPALVARFAEAAAADPGRKARWINLEYLSAEPYVERLHALPSPVSHGPGAGLAKTFFYPGFTPGTGGLLREPGLMTERAAFDRDAWLGLHGITRKERRVWVLFCYTNTPLSSWLSDLAGSEEHTCLLVPEGQPRQAIETALAALGHAAGGRNYGSVAIDYLPPLTQPDFDRLLWCGDLNFVRGEDSVLRALWAGAPLVWQIYPQDDGAHHAKLDAFLDWLDAPPSLRLFHHVWNGSSADALPALDSATLAEWQACVQAARARLLAQDDLVSQLRRFVAQKS